MKDLNLPERFGYEGVASGVAPNGLIVGSGIGRPAVLDGATIVLAGGYR